MVRMSNAGRYLTVRLLLTNRGNTLQS